MTGSQSPLQILPQFVEVLGKKLDKIRSEQDPESKCNSFRRLYACRTVSRGSTWPLPTRALKSAQMSVSTPLPARLRMYGTLDVQVDKMQKCYDALTTCLSEATVQPELLDSTLGL